MRLATNLADMRATTLCLAAWFAPRFAASVRAVVRLAATVMAIASIAVSVGRAITVCVAAVMRFGTVAIRFAVRAFAFEQAFLSARGRAVATAAATSTTTPAATPAA